MTKTFRSWITGIGLAVYLATAAQAANIENQTTRPATVRLRSTHPVIVSLIARGVSDSVTFRRIAQSISASDGIVYVEEGRCGSAVHACVKGVSTSARNRIVMIWIRLWKSDHDRIATIGHELRHAVEVLSDPAVTSSSAMYLFYRRHGLSGQGRGFETAAAVAAGDSVRAELLRSRD